MLYALVNYIAVLALRYFQDEDDEEGEPKGKKAKMSNNAKGKAASPKKNAKK